MGIFSRDRKETNTTNVSQNTSTSATDSTVLAGDFSGASVQIDQTNDTQVLALLDTTETLVGDTIEANADAREDALAFGAGALTSVLENNALATENALTFAGNAAAQVERSQAAALAFAGTAGTDALTFAGNAQAQLERAYESTAGQAERARIDALTFAGNAAAQVERAGTEALTFAGNAAAQIERGVNTAFQFTAGAFKTAIGQTQQSAAHALAANERARTDALSFAAGAVNRIDESYQQSALLGERARIDALSFAGQGVNAVISAFQENALRESDENQEFRKDLSAFSGAAIERFTEASKSESAQVTGEVVDFAKYAVVAAAAVIALPMVIKRFS